MKFSRTMIYCCLVLLQAALILQAQIDIVQAAAPYLLYTNRDRQARGVSRADLDGSNVQVLVSDMTASGLDFDYRDNTLFWSDIENERIFRANINGSEREMLTNDVSDPEIIGWDWINRKLYWTDVSRGTLEVMDPDTGYRKVLLNMGLEFQIRGLQLDPVNRWLYWTSIAAGSSRIARTSMDGSGTTILHDSTTVVVPNGVTVDSDTLYWVDASGSNNLIGKSGTSPGNAASTVFQFPVRSNPFHATIHDRELYFTDWILRSVVKVTNLDTTPSSQNLINVDAKAGMVKVFSADSQPEPTGSNPCAAGGLECSELCLLSATDSRGYTCACSGDVEINSDGRTCGEVTTSEPTTEPTTMASTTPSTGTPAPAGVCEVITCMNGGHCVDIPQGFQCLCPPTWTGTLCESQITSPAPEADNNTVIYASMVVVGVLIFMALVSLGLIVFVYWSVKVRAKKNKNKKPPSIDGLSMSSRDSMGAHFVLVNGRMTMSEHDYMSIKSRGNSPAPSRILICNVGDQGSSAYPNNYSFFEQPPPHILPPRNGTQTLEYMYPANQKDTATPEPIYNTVKSQSEKRQTL